MTTIMSDRPAHTGPRAAGPLGTAPRVSRPLRRLRAGQVAATQVALALPLAAAGRGVFALVAAAVAGILVLVGTWLPVRNRWLFEWTGTAVRYLTRTRWLSSMAPTSALLELTAPGATVLPAELAGEAAAVISDGYGFTALLELTDAGGLLTTESAALPSPAALLPAAGPDTPPIRIQLLLSGAPAPAQGVVGAGPAGTSYRQLTEGRLLSFERAVVAIRVLRADGWSGDDLRRALSSAVRKVTRRLSAVTVRPLGPAAAVCVLGELAHHDAGQSVQESWSVVRVGGLLQSTFQVRRWPRTGTETGSWLVRRLLALPATATTVSISAGPWGAAGSDALPAEMTVRLAAVSPAELAIAAQGLRRLVTAEGGVVRRLDGEQLDGIASTLPLGRTAAAPVRPVTSLAMFDMRLGTAGLVVGTGRSGAAVRVRLFRQERTRMMVVGGIRATQLIVLRAMALGARVVVQTARPRAWEPFVRAVTVPGEVIHVLPPGLVIGIDGTPLRPLLVVVDAGPGAIDPPVGGRWESIVVVRDELTPADTDALSRADLVVLQPLRPAEATLAGTALGLGESATLLTRIREDQVAVVNRRALRWVVFRPTLMESQLVGAPVRS